MTNKLRTLDFSSGIRAGDINYNFDTMDDQIKRERARIGGYGIVEGFDVEVISTNQVKIGEGIVINKSGEEVIVRETIAHIEDPDYAEHKLVIMEEALIANEAGEIVLPNIPYSPNKKGFIDNNYYQTSYPGIADELLIRSGRNPDLNIRAIRVEVDLITLDANAWAGHEIFVEYIHTKNRMDTVLINLEGEIKVEQGILSTSPSHVNLNNYDGWFVIALVEVVVGLEINLNIYEDHKTFRRVYVNKDNILYLNGKPYEESQIVHFEEPVPPYEHALWYDGPSNKLMIWKDLNGTFGWVAVNEEKHIPIKEVRMFSPEEFPEDSQTFLFEDHEIDLRFIPGHNQLEVIIDNAPMMSDQFEEVIDPDAEDYVNAGIGFKLKDPLDRATFVELRVLHSVHISPLRRTFQRTATFINDSFVYHSALNTNKLFETESRYVLGERQLEVFVDGVKMERTLDFVEALEDGSSYAEASRGKTTKMFKILRDIVPGQRVSYRITTNVYSYDHLEGWVDEIEDKSDQALAELVEVRDSIDVMDKNIQSKFKTVDQNIVAMAEKLAELDGFVKKTDKLENRNMPDAVMNNLFGASFAEVRPAESITILEDFKERDFVLAHYVNAAGSRVLIKEIDYVVQQDNNSLLIVLNSELVDSSSSLYVTGIRFGI